MDLPDSPKLTNEQRLLGQRVAAELAGAGIQFDAHLEEAPEEAWYRLCLMLSPSHRLSVEIFVAADTFEILANGADLRFESQDARNQVDKWADQSLGILRALLGSELRVRVRRTLGGGKTGAIWVPDPSGGAWSGDLFACLGLGREQRFPGWISHEPGGAV